jgi:hypothetical protein
VPVHAEGVEKLRSATKASCTDNLMRRGWRALPASAYEGATRAALRALQHVIEQVAVVAGIVAVDLVVAAHDRTRLRPLDRDFEREQVGLSVRNRVDDRVQPVAVGFVDISGVVLDRRDEPFALRSVDRFGSEDGAHQRVLGEVLEAPAVAEVAREVDPAAQHHVESPHPRFAPEHRARLAGQRWIEACAKYDGRRQGRGRVTGAVARIRDA